MFAFGRRFEQALEQATKDKTETQATMATNMLFFRWLGINNFAGPPKPQRK